MNSVLSRDIRQSVRTTVKSIKIYFYREWQSLNSWKIEITTDIFKNLNSVQSNFINISSLCSSIIRRRTDARRLALNESIQRGTHIIHGIEEPVLSWTASRHWTRIKAQICTLYQIRKLYHRFSFTDQQQIGMGICSICCAASNEGLFVSISHGLSSCGHAICATCAQTIMSKENRTCPYCRKQIFKFVRVLFP
jgi:hypothetical protein